MVERFAVPGVGGIIEKNIDGEDYILMQKRCKKDAPSEYGLLEIPAGKIREFENIFECLKREIKEETGLDVIHISGEHESSIIKKNEYTVLSYEPFCCAQNIEGKYPIIVQIFICQVKGKCLTETNESRNIHWVSLSELKVLIQEKNGTLYPMHIKTLEKYIKYKVQ